MLLCVFVIRSAAATSQESAKRIVFVSIGPQAYFVEQIAGELVQVEVLIPSGHSPATYSITPQQYVALMDADLYFRIGVPAEDRIVAKLPATGEGPAIVDTRHGITLRTIEEGDDGHDHSHTHGRGDPHTWLDPDLVKIQATTIAESLAVRFPDHRPVLDSNLAKFHGELDRIDSVLTRMLTPVKGKSLYVFHPSFGYFVDAYGLKQVAVESGGKEPNARQLAAFIERVKGEHVPVIFVQRQFSDKSARVIADEIGAKLVTLDPLARDYLANLQSIGKAVLDGLTGGMDRPNE